MTTAAPAAAEWADAAPAPSRAGRRAQKRGDDGDARGREFRADVQGLRAVAVLLVILDHAGVGVLHGGYVGVDAFFVVSGFVITRSLLRRGPALSLADFYAARARRILPLATVTIVATVIASRYLLNPVRAEQASSDGRWAALFAANVHFGLLGTDYFAATRPPSPLQHFWSLAVEEQFYLVWPLILLVLAGSARLLPARARASGGNRVVPLLIVICAVSFGWSVVRTGQEPAAAYFSTFARGWELGVGALVAAAVGAAGRLPAPVRAVLGWTGLGLLVGSAFVLGPATPFPGYVAAYPVLGAAAVVLAGTGGGRGGPALLLELRPLQRIGDWSYSIYLLHWPILVLTAGYLTTAPTLRTNLALVAGAIALSALTYRFVERPFRLAPRLVRERGTSLLLWPAATVLLLMVCLWTSGSLRADADRLVVAADSAQSLPGADPAGTVPARAGGADPAVARVRAAVSAARSGAPLPATARAALPDLARDFDRDVCHADGGQDRSDVCTYGDATAGRSILLAGDSHAMMWFPALDSAAKAHHWRLYVLLKPNCTTAEATVYLAGKGPSAECDRWRSWAFGTIKKLRPDRVVLGNFQQRLADADGSEVDDTDKWIQMWFTGMTATLRELKATGTDVTVLGDVPGLGEDPADCLLRRGTTMATCTYGRSPFGVRHNQATQRAADNTGVHYVDVTDWFCAEDRCPGVLGGMVAYIDDNHVSRTYALSLSTALAGRLRLS